MIVFREARKRPLPWRERRQQIPAWSTPFFALEWVWEWVAFALSRWTFVEVLEYFGTLSVLVAVIFYFYESGDRVKQRHYQAWQVINTAQGKGGSGGRIEALQELNRDRVPLVGVDVSGAFLQAIRLKNARLLRSDFSAADVRNSDFDAANLQDSNLRSANFRQSNFQDASLAGAEMEDGDFEGADFSRADLTGAVFDNADLRLASLKDSQWNEIRSIKGANVFGVHDAPAGFVEWATKHGAVQMQSDEQWENWREARKQ
ncbi:MAG TPA: pentapeptide repeat-containing protein [Terriglobales bacterium]|nr:pentapeptide repeat-containing protein [Terriglobales bacterium]